MFGVAGLEPDFDPGVNGPKAVQEIEQNAVAGGDRTVETDLTEKLLRRVGEVEADLLPLLHCVTGIQKKLVASGSEFDGAIVALEQRHVEFGFELTDVAREGGRADVCTSAGASKVQGLAQKEEVSKRSQVHSVRKFMEWAHELSACEPSLVGASRKYAPVLHNSARYVAFMSIYETLVRG